MVNHDDGGWFTNSKCGLTNSDLPVTQLAAVFSTLPRMPDLRLVKAPPSGPASGLQVPAVAERPYQRLAAQLLALIAQGEFKDGARLTSELTLAERFGVSRTSLREAIIALELQGAVEVRGGSGIYVCAAPAGGPNDAAPAFTPEAGPGPFELLRALCLI